MTNKILIADDERTIADTLTTIVKMHGFEARAAYDGEQAVAAARGWKPDIFLTDLLMPGMDGVDAALAICRILPNCRILLLSGMMANSELAARLRGHDFEVLLKPVPPEELVARLAAGRTEH